MDPKTYEESQLRIQEQAKELCTDPKICNPNSSVSICGSCYARNHYRYGWFEMSDFIQKHGYKAYFEKEKIKEE